MSESNHVAVAQIDVATFVRFLALGGFAAAVNWLSRFPLQRLMSFSQAVVAAYMIGMIVAFVLFRSYVFPNSPQSLQRQATLFILVNVLGLVQVWAVSMVLVYRVFPAIGFVGALTEPVGHGIAIGVPALSSYFGHRFLTFRGD